MNIKTFFTDSDEKIRNFINFQYVKMKKMAGVASLLLLAINLSFTIYPFIEHRFGEYVFGIPRAWITIPILFIFITFLILLGAHFYIKILEMYRTEAKANMTYNPYQVYAFQPFWEMWWRDVYIPQMKSQLSVLKTLYRNEKNYDEKNRLESDIKYMDSEIKKVQNWLELGYIPKEDFPKHLKKYYLTDKEQRL